MIKRRSGRKTRGLKRPIERKRAGDMGRRSLRSTRLNRQAGEKEIDKGFHERYHQGFNAGFAHGFEDGHQYAYRQPV